ncbi:polysaccharide pyruvyl transferase family protein [Candidatus Uabimicrobium amorphum]|uniref:ExoV-like protein n=1 Tax=Uabimicrobium amorphum TaxID=2596890 RepID=A0A5S9IKL1_UABAM|nr:polysaccharide pyruvyl transferase family protein [Candidatus Uabimicrobium amorphum]BBM83598.1 exoV-like protein [Candidatus Uabimicrobium amorphum]
MTKPLKIYWSASLKNGKKNFGDWLSPTICEIITRRRVVWAPPQKCDLAAVGSILQKFTKNRWWRPVKNIWGSGFLEQKSPFCSQHNFHAVRGKYSAQIIRNKDIEILGDPGLLCYLLSTPSPHKKYALGIVPHYKDQENKLVHNFAKNNKHVVVIDILSDPHNFIQRVQECEIILSSSLHGLIVADTFSIPNAWVCLSSLVRGNGFKFYDYYSAFGIETAQPFPFNAQTTLKEIECIPQNYSRQHINTIQQKLLQSFPLL